MPRYMTAIEIDERIARGDRCPCCLEPWHKRELKHNPECPWINRPDEVRRTALFLVHEVDQ